MLAAIASVCLRGGAGGVYFCVRGGALEGHYAVRNSDGHRVMIAYTPDPDAPPLETGQ